MAVPNPQNELARARKLAKKALPPIVLLTGPGDWFRQQALEAVLAAVPEDAELRSVDGIDVKDDADGAAVAAAPELQDLRGGGLFARTSFVVVRRGSAWWKKHGANVAELRPSIQAGSGLIVEAPKLDKRKRAAASLVKELTADGAVFEFRELYDMPYDRSRGPLEGELCQWVVAVSRDYGVPLQPEAAWLMIAQVGKAPAELTAELQRLRDRFEGKAPEAPLGPKDLAGGLTVSFSSDPFEFTEAVLTGDRRAAARSLEGMFARGVKQQDGRTMDAGGLLPFTTSWLFRQLCTTYEGRQLYDRGRSMRDVAQQLGVRQFVDRFAAQVERNTQPQLQRGIRALHSCQRQSRVLGEEPQLLLERFLQQWFDGAPIVSAEEMEL